MHTNRIPPRIRRHYRERMSIFARNAMLCSRVPKGAKETIKALAAERGMTTSEYLARLVNDHLVAIARQRGSAQNHREFNW